MQEKGGLQEFLNKSRELRAHLMQESKEIHSFNKEKLKKQPRKTKLKSNVSIKAIQKCLNLPKLDVSRFQTYKKQTEKSLKRFILNNLHFSKTPIGNRIIHSKKPKKNKTNALNQKRLSVQSEYQPYREIIPEPGQYFHRLKKPIKISNRSSSKSIASKRSNPTNCKPNL